MNEHAFKVVDRPTKRFHQRTGFLDAIRQTATTGKAVVLSRWPNSEYTYLKREGYTVHATRNREGVIAWAEKRTDNGRR